MAELSLALLGTLTAVYDQRPLTQFRTKAVQALLIYLTCQPESHSREALMALLWPELPAKSAQGNLRHALYHLRQKIPSIMDASGADVPFVLADRQTIRVNPDGRVHLDVTQFERLTDSSQADDWATAVSLYRADFLADFYLPDSARFESWAQSRRTDLRRRLLDTLGNLTNYHLEEGDFAPAEKYARQQLAIDNLHEEAHRQLMMMMARNGRRTDALTHYQALCQHLQDELGIAPSKETETLVEAIRNDSLGGGKWQMAGDRERQPVPHNLPPQATPFIGRRAELAALDGLLADPQTRLVTILGQGGMGKTRLSLAVAKRQLVQKQFAQGIFFVPLAGLGESDRIVSAIGEAMQIQLERGEPQLLNYVKSKEILLLLDNFEHLLTGSDLVRRLLQTAPQLQVLVTSRERLRLQGEQVYPIQGLAVDDTAVTDDARTLFLQAARRLQPDFEVTAESLPTLNHICQLVEGMPLALELAAAWVDMFTLEDIAAEIQRNLDFLETDLRDIPSRHRSMQAVFDTSYQQLPDRLQPVLAAMGVFRGGFTREAATAVAQASPHDLATLINKSLISFDPAVNRYHIHELLRQYSLARLGDTAVQDRHCTYYLDWLVQQVPKLVGAEQVITAVLVEREMDNIRVAINQALRTQNLDNFVSVLQALDKFYSKQFTPLEGLLLFDHMQTQLAASENTPPRILFWSTAILVQILRGQGQRTKAHQLWSLCQTSLAELAAQDNDIRTERAFATYIEGFDLYAERPDEARRLLQQSYDLSLELDDSWAAAHALRAMGLAARNQGDLTAAKAAGSQSLSLSQAINNQHGIISAQILLGELAGIDGRYEEAEKQLTTAITIARQSWPSSLEYALSKLQMVYFFSGQFKKGKVPLAENRLLSEEAGYTWAIARSDINQGLLRLHEGHYVGAQEMGENALQLGQEMGADYFICEAWVLLAQANIGLGDYEAAQKRLREWDQLCSFRPVGTPFYVAGNDLYWGIVVTAIGKTAVARQHLQAELETAVQRQDKLNLANALAAFARLHATENDAVAALEYYSLAQQHPFVANSRWFADVVGAPVTAVSQTLSPETIAAAQARGKEMDMWQMAATLLA